VSVILAQSVLGGVFIGLLAGLVTWCFIDERWQVALKVGAIIGLVAMAILYMLLLADARRLLWIMQTPLAMPEPPAKPERERLLLVNPPGHQRIESQADERRQTRFAAFVRQCERSTARRDLLKAFSETELAEWKAALFRLGAAAGRGTDPRGGWMLTTDAQSIIRRLDLE
jgi:MFS family permease